MGIYKLLYIYIYYCNSVFSEERNAEVEWIMVGYSKMLVVIVQLILDSAYFVEGGAWVMFPKVI